MSVTTTPQPTDTDTLSSASRPRPSTGLVRRLALLLVAVLSISTGFAATASSAHALAPGTPRISGLIGWDGSAVLAWGVPHTGGKPSTSYTVERYLGDAAQPQKTYVVPGHKPWIIDENLQNNTVYKYRVRATNADGTSGWTPKEGVQPKGFRTDLAPFEDATKFIDRTYEDLLGRDPSPLELAVGKISLHQNPSSVFVDSVASTPARVDLRHPVIRLYFAFFDRSPDLAGTNFWVAKRAQGTSLNQIAASFAASPEFKATYGELTNQQFVQQIYLNVFDRQPDANGLAYWTNQLDQKKLTRGQVMVGFSESNEYAGQDGALGRSTGRVEAADIWLAIMKEAPSTNGLDTYYAPHIQSGGSQGVLAMLLMPTTGYPQF